MRYCWGLLYVSVLLTSAGCAATGSSTTPVPVVSSPQPSPEYSAALDRVSSLLEGLSGQLLAMQDQVLTLKRQSLEQSQQLAGVQSQNAVLRSLLTSMASSDPQEANSPTTHNQDAVLAQLLDQVASISVGGGAQPEFDMVSSYTANGKWILIRYSPISGQSWLADNGQWTRLEESSSLPDADYRLTLVPARQDQKGFVAGRINRLTGQTWWLNQNRWIELSE